jgi:hypothetical protein
VRALEHLIVNEDGGIRDVVKTNAFGNRDDNLEVIAKSYEMKVISKMKIGCKLAEGQLFIIVNRTCRME